MTIRDYMHRQAFGDYGRADNATREEMEDKALEYAAQEQTRPTIFKSAGAQAARDRYESDAATAQDLMSLQALGEITPEQVTEYRERHGWRPRKW